MNSLIEGIQSFFSMIEAKFTIATIIMVVIFVTISLLITLTVISFRKRREALSVELPNINDQGEVDSSKSKFEKDKNITIELVDPNEDIAEDVPENNDETFFAALTMETRTLIQPEKIELDMPEVGEIDSEENEKMLIARENAAIDHLKKIAKADSEEDLSSIEGLNSEMNINVHPTREQTI